MNFFIIIILLLSSVLANIGFAQEIDVKIERKEISDTPKVIELRERFSRKGKQILLRITRMKDEVVQLRIHQFFDGEPALLGMHVNAVGSKTILTFPENLYEKSQTHDESGILEVLIFKKKDSEFVEIFKCEKGVFIPAEQEVIDDALKISKGDWSKAFKSKPAKKD